MSQYLGVLTEAEVTNGMFYFKDYTKLVMVQFDESLKLMYQE